MNRRWTVALVCLAIFMLVLDTTVVTVAIPFIQKDLHSSLSSIQWVIDAYTLTVATLLLGAAVLGDRFGRWRIFLIGICIFTASSLGCGLAGDAVLLDVLRGLQGVGGAVLFGVGVPLIGDAYPPGRSRDLAIGAFGAVSGSAVAIGPLVGGLLTQTLGWRAIFWINVPIGVAVLVASPLLVRRPGDRTRRLDLWGSLTSTAALFLVVLALIEGPRRGWGHPAVLASLAAGVATAATFVRLQLVGDHPLVDLGIFRNRAYALSGVVGVVLQGCLVATTPYLALYAQDVLRLGALPIGLRFLPFSLAAFGSAALVAPFVARTRGWLMPATMVLAAVGLAWLSRLTRTPDISVLLPGLLVAGTAVGVGATVLNRYAVSEVCPARLGMASGTSTALRQVGFAAGVAALGVVYQSASSVVAGLDAVMRVGTVTCAVTAVAASVVLARAPHLSPRSVGVDEAPVLRRDTFDAR